MQMRCAVGGGRYGVFWMDYEDHDKSMGACCCIRSLCRLIDLCFSLSIIGSDNFYLNGAAYQ